MLNIVQAKSLAEDMKAERAEHDDLVEDVQNMLLPYRGDVTGEWSASTERTSPTFDTTGVTAVHILASHLQGSIFNPSDAWLRLRAKGDNTIETRRLLDDAAARILEELDDSNFYQSMHAFLKDLAAIGNACLFMEERAPVLRDDATVFGGVDFEAVPFAKIWRRLDRRGRPMAILREFELHADEANEYFNKRVAEPTDSKKKCYYQCTKRTEKGTFLIYWWKEDGDSFLMPPEEIDYRTHFPAMWDRVDGQEYGYGPGHIVRPCLAGMQELARETIQAVGRELNPLLMVEHDSFMNRDVGANGIVTLKRSITRDPAFLSSGSNFQAADAIRRLDKEAVERAFFLDVLVPPNTQERSAEATRARLRLLADRMAGVGQAVAYALSEIVGGLMQLMGSRGQLPMLAEVPNVRPMFVSPFFTNAKLAVIDRIDSFVAERAQLAALLQDPTVMNRIDIDKVSEVVAQLSDVPADILVDDATLEARRQRDAAVAAEQRAAAAAPALETQLRLGDRNLPGIG